MNMKPAGAIFDPKKVINKNSEISNVTSPVCIPRRTPRKLLYQEDQYESFISKDLAKDFTCLNDSSPPVGILLERMMTMSYVKSLKKTKCQYVKRQNVSELT